MDPIKEKKEIWNDMDRTLDSVGNGNRLCILRDVNGWIEIGQEVA